MEHPITSSASAPRPAEGTAEWLLAPTRSWAFVFAVTLGFAWLEISFVRAGTYLHDEGVLTWMYSSYLARDPVATLFFLKAKPALAALNLLGAAFGPQGFYLGHVGIGCVGIVAIAAAARAAKVREPGLAALVFASSPMYLAGTAAGFSNVDVAALTACALFLILRNPTPGFWTGLVISVLPCVRFEAGVFALVMGLWLLARDRRARYLVGLVALPLAYLVAGAVWHRDPLWALHFPAAPRFAHVGVFGGVSDEVRRASVTDLVYATTTVSPVLVLGFLPAPGGPAWVRPAWITLGVFLAAMLCLPQLGLAMGYSQRYLLAILPVAVLLAVRRLEQPLGVCSLGGLGISALCFAPAVLVGGRAESAFVLSACAGSFLLAAVAGRRLPSLATVGLGVFVLVWPLARPPLDAFQNDTEAMAPRAVRWLRSHPGELVGTRVVVTNIKLLDAYLERAKDTPRLEVRCLIQEDTEYELRELTNPANGQRARVMALARFRFYGRGVPASEFSARPGPSGAIVIVGRDARLAGVDADALAARGKVLLRSSDLSILRLTTDPAAEDAAP